MARTHTPTSQPGLLHQRLAGALLRAVGVRWVSSGHCSRRGDSRCTSFEGLRAATFAGLLALKEASHCHLTVSGGTEAGHAAGRYSHGAGYKLDLLPNRCLDRYIPEHFERVPTRGDGAVQYRAPGPVMFARERSHWDITFGGAPDALPGRKGVRTPPGRDPDRTGRGEDGPEAEQPDRPGAGHAPGRPVGAPGPNTPDRGHGNGGPTGIDDDDADD
ncbi:hypothetical protein [Actinoallomurus soli]|uniref:hypothetical protein n=1 Tax=Actinoallomurus soli TaxID=2952535 RepID=UPI00209255F9|nr:hypothetical protein [Actinoallomurus soli]MCO5970089.1 hypothetical protein [Actinoallomurus soli]